MVLARGDFALIDERLCVIVGVEGDAGVPEGHLAAWFGANKEPAMPEAWTIPKEYFQPVGSQLTYRH